MNGVARFEFASLKAADEAVDHTVLKTVLTDLKEICRCADVVALSYMTNVADFDCSVSDLVSGAIVSNDYLWQDAAVLKSRVK